MDKLDKAIALLKAENRRLEKELKAVRAAIALLQRDTSNGHRRRMSAAARRRIAAAQTERWAKVEGQHKVSKVGQGVVSVQGTHSNPDLFELFRQNNLQCTLIMTDYNEVRCS